MSELVQVQIQPSKPPAAACALTRGATVFWLQGITLVWMLVECGLSLYAAAGAHSPVLLAFGSDTLWSCCPREWLGCNFYRTFPFPSGSPPVLLALCCSL